MDLSNLYRARIGLFNCAHKKQVGNGKKLCSASLIELYIIEMLICYCLCYLFYLLGMGAVYDVMKLWYLSTVICESLAYLITPCYIKGSTILLFMLLFITLIMLLLLLCGDIHTNPGPQYVYEDSSTSSSMISDCLSILHLNIRSIRHKIEYIKTELFDFDVLCFTETHIGSDYINCLSLEDYHQPIYKNRDNAGGVL